MRQVFRALGSNIRSRLGLDQLTQAVSSIQTDLRRLSDALIERKFIEVTPPKASIPPVSAPDSRIIYSERDLVCKWQSLDGSDGWFLVLPHETRDPVVAQFLRGEVENEDILRIAMDVTSPGDQIIDLGAHVGTFSIGAAAMGRKVLAVDASPTHIVALERSKALNRLGDLSILHAAISPEPGIVRFVEDGLFGAVDFSGEATNAIEVQGSRLDDAIDRHVTSPVKFIKMDIEGSECVAIETGLTMLQRDHPIIWFESNGPTLAQGGRTVDDLRRTLEGCGYKVFRVEGARWIYAPPGQIQPEAWVDMMALGEHDQHRWADRIDWVWQPNEILEKCRVWAGLPHDLTRKYLLEEISRHDVDASIRSKLDVIRGELMTIDGGR